MAPRETAAPGEERNIVASHRMARAAAGMPRMEELSATIRKKTGGEATHIKKLIGKQRRRDEFGSVKRAVPAPETARRNKEDDMSRLSVVEPEKAEGEVKKIFDEVQSRFGMVPNLIRAMGNSPVALKAYLTLDALISEGGLSPAEREIVRLVVSEVNQCRYCLAAHTFAGRRTGLNEEDMLAARKGRGVNPRLGVLAAFAKAVVERKGFVSTREIEDFRAAGYSDNEIGEVVAIIGQKTISNFFNHVHETELDFPAAVELETV